MLTQAVAEDLSVRFGIKWNFRELKTSQLAAVASGKQPKTLPNLIHEFAAVVPIHGVSGDVTFPLSGKQQLKRCYNFVSSNEPVRVHRGAKLLHRTEKGVIADATDATESMGRSVFHFDTTLDVCNSPLFGHVCH